MADGSLQVDESEGFISLQLIKSHLNVTHSEDDNLINAMLAAAIEQAEAKMGKSLSEVKCPQKVRAWIFLLVGDLYATRALTTPVYMHVRSSVNHLLDSERNYKKVM